jgi:hypothetical protein
MVGRTIGLLHWASNKMAGRHRQYGCLQYELPVELWVVQTNIRGAATCGPDLGVSGQPKMGV